jgi:hypothetical protein
VQPLRGPGEAQLFGDRDEVTQVPEMGVHSQRLSHTYAGRV